MDLKLEKLIVEYALATPNYSRVQIMEHLNVFLIANGEHALTEWRIRKVLEKYDIGKSSERWQAIQAIRKWPDPLRNMSMARSPIFTPSYNQPNKPGEFAFYGIINTSNGSKNVFQHTFIDGFSLFVLTELTGTLNKGDSINFLKKRVKPLFRNHGCNYLKVYLVGSPLNNDEFRSSVDDIVGFDARLRINKSEDLFAKFKKKINSELYSQLEDIPMKTLQIELANWVEHYNNHPNPKKYCYGKSPYQILSNQ